MKKCHTHFPLGKRLRVAMRDGTSFVSRLVARTDRTMTFEDRVVSHRELRNVTIWKLGPLKK